VYLRVLGCKRALDKSHADPSNRHLPATQFCPVTRLVTSSMTRLTVGTATNDKSKYMWVDQGYQYFSSAAMNFRLAVLEQTMSHLKVVFVLSGILARRANYKASMCHLLLYRCPTNISSSIFCTIYLFGPCNIREILRRPLQKVWNGT